MSPDSETPLSYTQAVESAQAAQWKVAMDEEVRALQKNGTWLFKNPVPARGEKRGSYQQEGKQNWIRGGQGPAVSVA